MTSHGYDPSRARLGELPLDEDTTLHGYNSSNLPELSSLDLRPVSTGRCRPSVFATCLNGLLYCICFEFVTRLRFCTLTETILCKNVDVKPQSMSKYYNRVRV